MNTDIRLSVGFWQHPKTKKTARRLGLDGVRSLQVLWLWAAQNRPDGNLSGMDWEDVELAADWLGEERAFFGCCLSAENSSMWIDEVEGGYSLHGWAEHNPWQAEAEARSELASKAARARWAGTSRKQSGKDAEAMRSPCAGHASASTTQCSNDAQALRAHQMGNAPLLSSPEEKKEDLKTHGSSENEDPARDTRSEQVGLGKKDSPAIEDKNDVRPLANEPTVEFQELREWYSAHCRPEGPLAGFTEFRQAKAARTWPGQTRIYDDLAARAASESWRKGYAPSLANYLRTRGWEAPPERNNARASPAASAQGSLAERNAATARLVLAELEAEHGN